MKGTLHVSPSAPSTVAPLGGSGPTAPALSAARGRADPGGARLGPSLSPNYRIPVTLQTEAEKRFGSSRSMRLLLQKSGPWAASDSGPEDPRGEKDLCAKKRYKAIITIIIH